jgi:hypothetical protein
MDVPGGRDFFAILDIFHNHLILQNSRKEHLSCDLILKQFAGLMSAGIETET